MVVTTKPMATTATPIASSDGIDMLADDDLPEHIPLVSRKMNLS